MSNSHCFQLNKFKHCSLLYLFNNFNTNIFEFGLSDKTPNLKTSHTIAETTDSLMTKTIIGCSRQDFPIMCFVSVITANLAKWIQIWANSTCEFLMAGDQINSLWNSQFSSIFFLKLFFIIPCVLCIWSVQTTQPESLQLWVDHISNT